MKAKVFFVSLCIISAPMALVPKNNTPIEEYEKHARHLDNVGELTFVGDNKKTCTATLIGRQGDVGVLLTAGHCLEIEDRKILSKCSNSGVSFAAQNPSDDTEYFTVIGRYAWSKYVDESEDYEYDLGVVFVHLGPSPPNISPYPLTQEKEFVGNLGVVHVVGYGRTGLFDNSQDSTRRIMSTHAKLEKKNGHVLIAMDEEVLVGEELEVPIGDSAAEGDSGGPIIHAAAQEIVGVVSHKSGGVFYSEPVFKHIDWLYRQIALAQSYTVFIPEAEAKISSASSWLGGKSPKRFRTPYGEINPMVSIRNQQRVTLDSSGDVYGVSFGGLGGSIVVDGGERVVESLSVNASAQIGSSNKGSLIVDCLSVNTDKSLVLDAPLRVVNELNIESITSLNKVLRLISGGRVHVKKEIDVESVVFDSSAETFNSKDLGSIVLTNGVLKSKQPVDQVAHILKIEGSSVIKTDYRVRAGAELAFSFGEGGGVSTPLLTIEGRGEIAPGVLKIEGQSPLPVDFDAVIVRAQELVLASSWSAFYDERLTDSEHRILFEQEKNELRMKVVPVTQPKTSRSRSPYRALYEVF